MTSQSGASSPTAARAFPKVSAAIAATAWPTYPGSFEGVEVVRADHRPHARRGTGSLEVQLVRARARVRRAEYGRVQHPRQLEVGGVLRATPRALRSVDSGNGPAYGRQRSFGPLVEGVFLDDDPLLGVLPFDFLLASDQSCHVLMASSILGYVPQRQRFPDMA
jgi:hypothetical protein